MSDLILTEIGRIGLCAPSLWDQGDDLARRQDVSAGASGKPSYACADAASFGASPACWSGSFPYHALSAAESFCSALSHFA